MAHLLIITTGLTGVVHASLEVVRRLEAAGHRVTYACPHNVEAKVRPYVQSYVQLSPVAMNPSPMVPRAPEGAAPHSRLGHKRAEWRTRKDRRRQGAEALGMDAFAARLAELAPDAVLLDVELYEHAFTARSKGLPVALLAPWFQYSKRPGVPPLASSVVPGQGWVGSRPGLEATWIRYRAMRAARMASIWARYFGTDRRGVLVEYARSMGVEGRALWPYDWIMLFSMAGFPIWSLTASELDFEHSPPEHWTYAGPMILKDRVPEDAQAAERLEAAVGAARRRGHRIVYASSSTKDPADAGFTVRLAEAARRLQGWTLLMGMGGDRKAADALRNRLQGDASASVEVFDWAPQLSALSAADVTIHHGGIHSTHEALQFGLPTVVYSGGLNDQNGCAARLASKGLSLLGSKSGDDPGSIAEKVAAAAGDARLHARVAAMKLQMDAYRANEVLEGLVAGLVSESAPPKA